jgi:hypothetical protein
VERLMPGTKRPRKRYRPAAVELNTMGVAAAAAAKLRPAAIAEAMEPVRASLAAMQSGTATEDHWCVLAGSVEVGLAIEEQGVIRGLEEHLKAAELTLATIRMRARLGGAIAPQGPREHEALDTFGWLYERQLQALSAGEWHAAHARAMRRVLGDGGQAVDIADLAVSA